MTPPDALPEGHVITRVVKAEGKNLYTVELSSSKTLLVELEAKFRSTIWLKRAGFVVVDTTSLGDRDNKLEGEIVNVVRDEKKWRKKKYWPAEFQKITASKADEDDEPNVDMMPPTSDEELGI